MEGLIFQSSEFGTDEIYANMEEYIMQITRDNYSYFIVCGYSGNIYRTCIYE